MVCSRGESPTHHMNQMKLFKAIAATAAVITCCIGNALPAEAGRLYSLKHNVGVSRNDGNPRFVITDGSRLRVYHAEENRNPLGGGGYGYQKVYGLSREQMSIGADFLHEGRNCVDTLRISGSSSINDTYEQAMYMSC